MKHQYDKTAKELNYQIGDKVLLDVRITGPDKNKKLTPKFEGPYHILEVNSNSTVKIINSNFNTQLVHINRIKPLFETSLWKDEPPQDFEEINISKTLRRQGQPEMEEIQRDIEEILPTVEECSNSLESENEEENSITESSGRLRPRINLQIPLRFR